MESFLLAFCILLISILWVFQTVLLNDMYKYIRKQEIKEAIKFVEKSINSSSLQLIFDELEEFKEIIVVPTQEFVLPPGLSGNYHNVNNNRGRAPESITEIKEFILADGRVISLTFHAMITPVDATVSTLKLQLYIIIGIMFSFSIILAIIIAKRIAKPIEEINESAKVLATGDYNINFNGHGFLEIKELSNTSNKTAKELSKVESLRKELMANISHDLRTPLALIYSYAEMMQDFPNEISNEQTQIIMDETKRLTSLVNDVLDVSQLETGTMELNFEKYNITSSINKTIQRISKLIKNDGYTLKFEFNNDIFINADKVKITQAFYNLLINAINYTGENKMVSIVQKVIDNKVRIEIIDYGEDIDSENIPYIGDRYYKLNKKHKRPITGTGLGLSIVKKIITLYNGNYGVESVSKKGSTFWFELELDKNI